jgi:hypothetical protein
MSEQQIAGLQALLDHLRRATDTDAAEVSVEALLEAIGRRAFAPMLLLVGVLLFSPVNRDGFSLNCAVACQAHQRDRLERLCRYITRPALCLDRLSINAAKQVVYELKNPYRDGTTHILFNPEDFIARLAALVPRPRINLTRYHGVFAPSSPMRGAIAPSPASARRRSKLEDSAAAPATLPCSSTESRSDCNDPPTAPLTWAQRLKRVFEIDITLCSRCGGILRVIGDVTDPDLIRKLLNHVDSRAPPRLPPRRAESDTTHPNLFAGRQ